MKLVVDRADLGQHCRKGTKMPHIIVKMYPGRSAEAIAQLADAITRDVVAIAGCAASSVSVAVEEVPPEKWTAEVFLPDIQGQADKLVKKPGYDPLAEPV